jgi:hypothetical protein
MTRVIPHLETKLQLMKKTTELTSIHAVWPGCMPRRKDQQSFRKKITQDLIQSRLLDSWLLQAVSMRTRSRLMAGERRWGEKCVGSTLSSVM